VSHTVITLLVLWRNRETEGCLVLKPKPRNCRGDFEAQITKSYLSVLRPKWRNPRPPWFWGSTKKSTAGFEVELGETVTTSFEDKLEETVVTSFEAKLEKTIAIGFEAKPLETVTTGFEVKPAKTVRVVLRPNHSQTVAIGFEAQTNEKPSQWFWGQTTDKPPTLVLRLNQETPALHLLLLSRSSSLHAMPHRPPAQQETSKHDSSNETKIKEKQNETVPDLNSNLVKSMTHHNQTKELTTWFINLPLDESIDNKSTKFEIRIQEPMKHS
jgi:hypothetical protein